MAPPTPPLLLPSSTPVCSRQVDELAGEPNRSIAAAGFAEIRSSKFRLLSEDLPKTEKLLKSGKNVTADVIDQRRKQLSALKQMIEEIPDGANIVRRPQPVGLADGGGLFRKPKTLGEIQVRYEADDPELDPAYYQQTDENRQFDAEWRAAQKVQDQHLERIGKGVEVIKEIAQAQGDELRRQEPLVDLIEDKIDDVGRELQNNNKRLKAVVLQVRGTRKFCFDFILIAVVLGVGMLIFTQVRK